MFLNRLLFFEGKTFFIVALLVKKLILCVNVVLCFFDCHKHIINKYKPRSTSSDFYLHSQQSPVFNFQTTKGSYMMRGLNDKFSNSLGSFIHGLLLRLTSYPWCLLGIWSEDYSSLLLQDLQVEDTVQTVDKHPTKTTDDKGNDS